MDGNTKNCFRTKKLKLTDEDFDGMNYFDKCDLLNSSPVFLARHFQYHMEIFFKKIVLIPISTLGKVTYYAIIIEFLVRGSPHVHSFLWI